MKSDTKLRVEKLETDAQDSFVTGDIDNAILLYSKCLFLEPENYHIFVKRADVYLSIGDLHAASSNLRRALALAPNTTWLKQKTAQVIDTIGCLYFDEGEMKLADACFREALGLEKREPAFWMHSSLLNLEKGNLQRALAHLSEYLKIEKGNADAYILRGKIFWKLGLGDKATADVKEAKFLAPRHPDVQKFDAILMTEADSGSATASKSMLVGDFESALAMLKSGLRVNPRDVRMLLSAASAARQLCRLKEAYDFVKAAKQVQLDRQRDFVSDDHKQQGAALVSSRETDNLKREEALCLHDLAVESMSNGYTGTSVLSKLNKSITLLPSNAIFYQHRGDYHRKRGNNIEALADYQHALELDPRDTGKEVHHRIALIRYVQGQQAFNSGHFDQACDLFSTAIEFNPFQAEYYSNRGLAQNSLDRMKEAHNDFQRALDLDPNNTRAKIWLAAHAPKKQTQAAPTRLETSSQSKRKYSNRQSSSKLKDLKRIQTRIQILQKPLDIRPKHSIRMPSL